MNCFCITLTLLSSGSQPVVREGFSGGTRVTSIYFYIKPGFTAFLYFIYPFLFLINKFWESMQFLLFRNIAIFMHVKQCQLMRHKPNNDFCTKQIENVINSTVVKFLNQPCIMPKRKRDWRT